MDTRRRQFAVQSRWLGLQRQWHRIRWISHARHNCPLCGGRCVRRCESNFEVIILLLCGARAPQSNDDELYTGIMLSVKRAIIFLVTATLLTACVGNVSLWGQYQTPTPIGGPVNVALISDAAPTETIVQDPPTPIPTISYSPTPTSLLNNFVTQPPSETPLPLTPTPDENTILYYAQSGDWLPAVASRFGVEVNEITSPKILSDKGYLDPGTLLIIPNRVEKTVQYSSALQLLPDTEFVYSSTALNFDIAAYLQNAGGYLSTY